MQHPGAPLRRWLALAPLLLVTLAACSGDDDDAGPRSSPAASSVHPDTATESSTTAAATAATASPTSPPAGTTGAPPSFTTPDSVITDTEAIGGSTISTVDPTRGTATTLGAVPGEVGVLGMTVTPDGAVHAVTDGPAVVTLDLDQLDATGPGTPIGSGTTLLALASGVDDGGLVAIDDTGAIVRLDPATGATSPVAQVELTDPGVGLDVAADGSLEVVTATGQRWSVDLADGTITDLPAITDDTARIVALAHVGDHRYGIDSATDALVTIADDGTLTIVGPLGLDATDGASLAVDGNGRLLLANPG